MAFQLSSFDVLKQHYDGTGLFHYHDSVDPAKADPTTGRKGDALATIATAGFFNPVVDQLAIGSLIIVSTIAACGVYVVTKLYDTDDTTPEVTLTAVTAAASA